MRSLKNVTLEMSLKPFKVTSADEIRKVCSQVFSQWNILGQQADTISVLLWTSDGSEILDYKGSLDDELEWAKYIGGANNRNGWNQKIDPQGIGLHTTCYLYIDQPPVITYRTLQHIVSSLKKVGNEITGKPIRVGATFDPGPEFAKSEFKYERHPEILLGNTMGRKSFVCCYSSLHTDDVPYAGYPSGIPAGTPFGTFFGKQANHFMCDLGFDYLWLSNGFGFGTETWGTTGVVFDGEAFNIDRLEDAQRKILEFWKLFRHEFTLPVETRGTNLTAGIDLATDGVNLKGIYEGGFDLLAPPNSPWAALNGDFGLELAGYMSRMAELPCDSSDDDFLFRFYVHDPWWMNSPWQDRYEGQPHDIYLPLAISRLDSKGQAHTPNRLNLLTIDNSLGEMPWKFPLETIPHLLTAYEHHPDEAAPIVWVYPFDEYHDAANMRNGENVGKPFFEDWFIRGAINHGLPLSSVISTRNFISSKCNWSGSILVTPVPQTGSAIEHTLMRHISSGGNVVLYGSVTNASKDLLELLNLSTTTPVSGVLDLSVTLEMDCVKSGEFASKLMHSLLLSDGAIDTTLTHTDNSYTKVFAKVVCGSDVRVVGVKRTDPHWQGGSVVWLRGTNSNSYTKGAHLLTPHNPVDYFPMETLLRLALQELGYSLRVEKEHPQVPDAVTMVYRHDNGFFFSGYMPNTTVQLKLRFPLGAPLLLGRETKLEKGHSTYYMPRAWHAECRIFVDQKEDALISYKEEAPVSYYKRRRVQVAGLKNARVYIFPQQHYVDSTEILLNSNYPYLVGQEFKLLKEETPWGMALVAEDVSGKLLVSI